MSRVGGFDLKLDCQLRMKFVSSVWSSLVYFLLGKEGLISRWPMGVTKAETGSCHKQKLSLVLLKKVALFYLIRNLIIGNTDLTNDLFCFPCCFGCEYLGQERIGLEHILPESVEF